MATTTRWALPYPQLDGLVAADVPQWMHDLAFALDDVAKDDQGTLANRPVSTSGSPGKKGRYYMVVGDGTPANNGILWRDNGTGWDPVGTVADGAVTTAKLADSSVTSAKIVDAAIATADLANSAVTSAKIADGTIVMGDLAPAAAVSPLDQGGTRYRLVSGAFTVSHVQNTSDSFSFPISFPTACDAIVINMHSGHIAVLESKTASGATFHLDSGGASPADGSFTGDYIAIGH